MKKFAGLLVLASQAFIGHAAQSADLDVAIASDMAAAEITQRHDARGRLWSIGATRNGDEDASAAYLTFNVTGDVLAAPNLRSGLGWKAVMHDTFQRAYSLAIGGSFRYELPQVPGVGLETQLYYAPEVLNSHDANRYHELLARVTYDLHSRAKLFAGWMDKTVRYESGAPARRVEINHAFNVGFRLDF